jgi:hypothetical protein
MRIGQKKCNHSRTLALTSLVLVIVSTFSSCSLTRQKTLDKLQGHWHMDSPYQMTLDINHTSVEVNKYSLFETPEQFSLFDSAAHDIVLPVPCGCGGGKFPYVNKFSFRSDMLIYNNKIVKNCYAYSPMRFVRGDLKTCKQKHTIQGNDINVKLSAFPIRSSYVVDLDSLRRTSLVSYISIGLPTNVDMFGSSPKIQVNDVYIEPRDIQLFISSEKARYPNEPHVFCLNVDNAVSDILLEEVISVIRQNSVAAIYRLVTLPPEEKKYGYQKIWP